VVYDYRGLQARELEQRITTFNEFIMSTVNDVKSIDSQTVRGYAVLMIYFSRRCISTRHRTGRRSHAIDPLSLSARRKSALGASLQRLDGCRFISLPSRATRSSQSELYDYGIFRIRQQISVVPGTMLEAPHGGVVRQIMVDLDQQALLSKSLTPMDIEAAISNQDVNHAYRFRSR